MADVQPFYIYPLDEEEAHLCPVRAMAEWIRESQVTSGFLFRRFMAQDRPSAHEDIAMVSFYKKRDHNWLKPVAVDFGKVPRTISKQLARHQH
jgi:hypothetical protein